MLFAFNDFCLDVQTHELLRAGRRVSVQPKVFKLLLHLVTHRHRSVTNEELLSVLWPGERVSPASITSAVRSARRVLGDAGTSQAVIRTVRGHGYRFVLPVALAPGAHDQVGVEPERAQPPALAQAATDAAFIGRTGVLAALDRALALLETGQGCCLLLAGEPGIGKTRTLHELTARARRGGARVWFARCFEGDGAPPFWPMIQLVREAAEDLGPAGLRILMGMGAEDIAHAIPELRRWLTDLPEDGAASSSLGAHAEASASARFRFFDSFTTFVKRAAQEQRLVLVFDDLQQADEPTARLLAFMVKQLEHTRILVAGATRPAGSRRLITELVSDLGRPASSVCIDLPGFEHGEVAHYLAQRTGVAAPNRVVTQLHDQTAGNPLYLQQLVDELRTHAEANTPPPWEQLLSTARGGGVEAAIERQLETVSVACRTLLRTAAVLGRDFSFGLLLAASGRELDTAARARMLALLSEARSCGLVFTSDSPNHYRFKHALIRDALCEQTPPHERVHLHQAAALALEARGAGANTAELAQMADHFVHAAPLLGTERALRYVLQAAQDAVTKLAYEEAAAHVDRALAVLALGVPDTHRRLELLLAKGEALVRATLLEASRSVLLEAAELAREIGSREGVLRAVTLLARAPEDGTPDPILVTWLREVLALLEPTDPRKPELLALLAKALSYSPERDEYVGLALRALEGARRPDIVHRTETLYACHQALAGPQHLAIRMRISDELSRLGHRLGDSVVLMHAAITQIWNAAERGDMLAVELAQDTLESLVPGAREPFFHWCATLYRAMRAFVRGDLRQSQHFAQRALEFEVVVGEDLAQHAHATQLSGILGMQGRLVEAEALARSFSARYPALGSWRATHAILHAYLGHPVHARRVLEDLIADDMHALRGDPYWLAALAPAAQLCAIVGDAALARPLYDAILPYEGSCGQIAVGQATHGPMARHLGLLALRLGDVPRALGHLERAVAHAERMQSPTFISMCSAVHASALVEANTPSARAEAREVLTRAIRLGRECQLSSVVTWCEPLAAKLGTFT